MGRIKEAYYESTFKFCEKFGDIFISLYCYEYNNQYNKCCDLPEFVDQTVIDNCIFILDHYFNEILKDEININIDRINIQMLFDELQLWDY